MLSAEQIAALAGSLGTPEGLIRVSTEMESLRLQLAVARETSSREELARMVSALERLSVAILSMARVTREMLGQAGLGAVGYVG